MLAITSSFNASFTPSINPIKTPPGPTLFGPTRICIRATILLSPQIANKVNISNSRGSITIKLEIIEMVNDVVWIPSNNHDSKVKSKLGAKEGDVVTIKKGSF